MNKTAPAPTARMTSVFGPMGINNMKQTEDAFEGGIFGGGATISTSPDFGWDFEKGKLTGTATATPNRGIGAIRDNLVASFGTPYDREITPEGRGLSLLKGKADSQKQLEA